MLSALAHQIRLSNANGTIGDHPILLLCPGVVSTLPELLPARYFKVDGEVMTIYYVMSTWNPYQAVLIRAQVTTGRFARLLALFSNLYSSAQRMFGQSETTTGINFGQFGVHR
jgi:hypothetical protein